MPLFGPKKTSKAQTPSTPTRREVDEQILLRSAATIHGLKPKLDNLNDLRLHFDRCVSSGERSVKVRNLMCDIFEKEDLMVSYVQNSLKKSKNFPHRINCYNFLTNFEAFKEKRRKTMLEKVAKLVSEERERPYFEVTTLVETSEESEKVGANGNPTTTEASTSSDSLRDEALAGFSGGLQTSQSGGLSSFENPEEDKLNALYKLRKREVEIKMEQMKRRKAEDDRRHADEERRFMEEMVALEEQLELSHLQRQAGLPPQSLPMKPTVRLHVPEPLFTGFDPTTSSSEYDSQNKMPLADFQPSSTPRRRSLGELPSLGDSSRVLWSGDENRGMESTSGARGFSNISRPSARVDTGLYTPSSYTFTRPSATTGNHQTRYDLLQHSTGSRNRNNFEKTLPKIKLQEFSGDPLEWPEWSGLFYSTIGESNLSDSEKLTHLRSLLTGQAKRALSGIGYSGQMYETAWNTLERKFGQPHLIVSSQLGKLSKFNVIKPNDFKAIVELSDAVSHFVNVLQQFNYTNDLFSASNLDLVVSKLPVEVKRRWFAYIDSAALRGKPAHLMMFSEWLQDEAAVQDRLAVGSSWDVPSQSNETKRRYQRGVNFGANEDTKKEVTVKGTECPMKDGNHRLWHCELFKKQSISERYNTVKSLKLCFSCLSAQHLVKNCQAGMKCNIDGCEKRHNRLLHNRQTTSESSNANLAGDQSVSVRGLLQVAPVRVFGNNGSHIDTFGICDTGSSHSWVDDGLMKTLKLKGQDATVNVAGIHGTSPLEVKRMQVSLGKVGSNLNDAIRVEANSHSKLKVGSAVYDIKSMKEMYPHLKCIKPNSVDLKKVRIILGQDCYTLIRPLEYRSQGQKAPWAVKLPLGWTVSGPLPVDESGECHQISFLSAGDRDLAEQLRSWWDMESYGTTVKVDNRSQEDKLALVKLQDTLKHTGERYQLGLLWKDEKIELPNNYYSALGQLNSLKMRLGKNPELNEKYRETIEQDIEKGYVKELTKEEMLASKNHRQWYLPHHGVNHPHKPGKLRRVCNAASKHCGVSLNDALVTGPDLLQNLVGVLLRFREYPIAITADIEAMFLQVEVRPEDQLCLRFLWKDTQEGRVRVLQYMRHVFGAKSSPTCANFALQQCGRDNASTWPDAAEAVRKSFYMDDLLKSLSKISDAQKLCINLVELLAKGGFKITKFISNVEDAIPNPLRSEKGVEMPTVLGMRWDVDTDELELCRGLDCKQRETWTQRQVLSVVSSVFDPMGILAPFVIRARLILKQIWQTHGQSWDNFINEELNNAFVDWVDQSKSLGKMAVPRCFTRGADHGLRQLHVFADASEEAFCAVVYLRTHTEIGSELSFIIGKSRVAPQKFLTIPKLELMAAVIAIRLKNIVVSELTIEISSIHFWTDSSTVLQWIRANIKKQQVFVANRVAEIMEGSTVDQWCHVPGQFNPADLGTRGLSSTEMMKSAWLTGPAWLHDEKNWPKTFECELEQTEEIAMMAISEPMVDWKRFSSFSKLRNAISWILKWKYKGEPGTLTADLIGLAERALWKLIQREHFQEELLALENGNSLSAKSKLLPLVPFIDNLGILRAKGRLRKASIDFNAKHPIILDSKNYVVRLFLIHMHTQNHHEGVEYIRSLIQQNFWIFGLRNCLRQIKQDCLECKRVHAKLHQPMMADLPNYRLEDSVWPFKNTGVDYFGPIQVVMFRRTLKRWVCLFTCLTTRAIHLEVVPSLETDACLTAIRRFIARRGQPSTIISDNGTNFVGAAREFREYIEKWNKQHFENHLAQQNIRWIFNPPSAPHFGGAWERMVRACKKSMWHVLGRQKLTDDVLVTVTTQVEQLLNARPLTPNSSDVNDLEALTPNHFLLGRSSVALPFYAKMEDGKDVSLRKAFQASEQLVSAIWKRWLNEYLPQLQQRSKWQSDPTKEVTVGDLVWLCDGNVKRSHYPLARIVELHFGDDGKPRSAKIKTSKGVHIRPLVKLIPLNIT